ncbi:hypothetical protein PV08_08479 [Exophiala spinifera]|uniref:Uncharacterized protein n=1 Tax=Exophiala spinifera TaxID=91928 RepID=A0A0D1YDY8_9EURO|nr:uncharacterized protein PV08_08479 [Exophiala spinifera]KIW13291.1 hypothetical protein PV08_08479 [Exophiala spinifera]
MVEEARNTHSSTYSEIANSALDVSLWQQLVGSDVAGGDMFLENLALEWTKVMVGNQTSETSPANFESGDPVETPSPAAENHGKDPVAARGRNLVGSWQGSPMRLLNSSVELLLLNQSLGEVYEYMMSGIAIRYLDYNCNLFAGSYRYSFVVNRPDNPPSEPGSIQAMAKAYTPPWKRATRSRSTVSRNQTELSPEILSSQTNKVTMIGIARFLDNFGSLYGNIIDAKTRKQNDRTLTAVLQAFSLQFSPSRKDDPSSIPEPDHLKNPGCSTTFEAMSGASVSTTTHIFVTAWLNAYEHLIEPQQCPSFLRFYAVFLFMMTTVPSEALVGLQAPVDTLNILDSALRQMQELRKLIDSHCSHLDNTSIYKFLFQSCLDIFGWYAYLRDTISSVLNARTCILDDAPLRLKATTATREASCAYVSAFDIKVPSCCQSAAGDLFHLFRQVIRLRDAADTTSVSNVSIDVANLQGRVRESINTMNAYTSLYGSWLEQCIISFYRLSEESKLSSAFLLLFWNLARFQLVEQLHIATDVLPADETCSILEQAQALQASAVQSAAATARRIADISATGQFRLLNSTQARLQFVCHHANTSLVVLSLVKAIEHTIDLNVSPQCEDMSTYNLSSSLDSTRVWIDDIKPLLTCLLTVASTISGSYTARPALQQLMQQYGDILMDCWSHEEATKAL